MRIEHFCKMRVRRDHGSAESTDRALLFEHRPSIESTPLTCRPNPGADLHVNVAVGVVCGRCGA